MIMEEPLKHALAIAIVRQRRQAREEAASWREKAQQLEAELQQQQANHTQLRQWACSVLHTSAAGGSAAAVDNAGDDHNSNSSTFLPPLPAAAVTVLDDDAQLQRVLGSKAAALSDMLLTHMQMTAALNSSSGGGGGPVSTAGRKPANPTDMVAVLSRFVLQTLLEVPSSSLRTAYMKQCAGMLAAVLAGPSADGTQQQEPHLLQQQQQQQHEGCQAGRPLQQQQQRLQQVDEAAVLAAQLMQQLLACKSQQGSSADAEGSEPAAAAAAQMLQQLSAFPSTAVLLLLATAQHLQQQVLVLQRADAVFSRVHLSNIHNTMQQAEAVLETATAAACQAAHDLQELGAAISCLPAWSPALACGWACQALGNLVSLATALFSAAPGLQDRQPLLAAGLCQLCAQLATSLQHVATAADAPGMAGGSGAELRRHCGSLCVTLRDLFMPH